MSKQQRPYGGYWTQVKLRSVRRYLTAFMERMEGWPYRTMYVDAFAGSGLVTMPKPTKVSRGFIPASDAQPCIEGSAIQSLRLPTPFDEYFFVERSPQCCSKLNKFISDSNLASLQTRISAKRQDANVFLMDYCRSMRWDKTRAVVFLDPFGPVVEWETLKTIAGTEAVDVLYMFPLGIAVTRMLRLNGGDIDGTASARLNALFGTSGWYMDLFRMIRARGLIPTDEIARRQQGCDAIIKYFLGRLRTIFAHVARNPLKLRNSRGLPMYLLCFASPSEHRTRIARKIFQTGCPTGGPRLIPLVACR